MSLKPFCEDASIVVDVTTTAGTLHVVSISYTEARSPLSLLLGPAVLSLNVNEACALGSALIEVAHHWQAAIAVHQQHLAEAAHGGEA